jgi:flagellar biosynthesis protein FlhB
MMENVATATAVIVNPTHYAIAIRYDHETMATPLVVAKGKNYLALRIRKRALEHNIPLVENPPLAQALYKSVDVGKEIPAHLYRAVAGCWRTYLSFDALRSKLARVPRPNNGCRKIVGVGHARPAKRSLHVGR